MRVEFVLTFSLVLCLDLGTKWWVRRRLREGESLRLGKVIRLERISAVGFGIGLIRNPYLVGALYFALLIAFAALFWYGKLFASPPSQAGLGLALGGASGNLLERLHRGVITDFIDSFLGSRFNLADLAIFTGVLLTLVFR